MEPVNPPERPFNLREAFNVLQLDLSAATTKAVLGQNWTVPRIEREFAKRQKQKLNVHAEVQMLLFMNTNDSSISGLFPYFGCSKLSCFMCSRFLQADGRFSTRGCHGRLFKPWTLPNLNQLLPGQANRIAKVLKTVQKEVKQKLKPSVAETIRHERTSVIGENSVVGGRQEERSQRQLHIDRLRMKAERERVAEMFRRSVIVYYCLLTSTCSHRWFILILKRQAEDTIIPAWRNFSIPEEGEPTSECDICDRPTTRRCDICSRDFFCSNRCQEKRSGSHLFMCSKRPLNSADYLWKSLVEDLMPQDEDVLKDFGFNSVLSDGDRPYLLGVYGGLYLSGKFSAEDLHKWRVGGILVEKIKEFYYSIPEGSRGEYFPWFLKNSNVLDHSITQEESQKMMIATFFDKARLYLESKDRTRTPQELKPEAKAISYILLAQILHRNTPNPVEKGWYSFGFVTCRGQEEEGRLLDLYQLVLTESDGSSFYQFHNRQRSVTQPATFTQFWKAHEAATLIQLMDSKGLKQLRSQLPFLEGFLSVPPAGPHPSVWSLKQFLEINDPMENTPCPSVNVDYGFANCRTFEETCILMEIYKMVLRTANPLELHQACVAGDLFRFASGYVPLKECWRSLMRNFYPLKEQ